MSSALPVYPDDGEAARQEAADQEALHNDGVRLVIKHIEPDYAADALDAFGLTLLRSVCKLYRKAQKAGSAFKAHRDGCYQGALGVFARLYPFDRQVFDNLSAYNDTSDSMPFAPTALLARYSADAALWEQIIKHVSERQAWKDD
jgi:hypothetical protein